MKLDVIKVSPNAGNIENYTKVIVYVRALHAETSAANFSVKWVRAMN